jgi:hypothetical protein
MRRRRRSSSSRTHWLSSPIATVLGALAIALLLAGCGEKPQDVVQKEPGTTVTRDSSPWEAQRSRFAAPDYASGDRAAYEHALKQRTLQQHEYVRIGDAK